MKKINNEKFLRDMKSNIPDKVSSERVDKIMNLLDTIIANICKDFDRKQIIEDIIYVQYLVSKLDKLIPVKERNKSND